MFFNNSDICTNNTLLKQTLDLFWIVLGSLAAVGVLSSFSGRTQGPGVEIMRSHSTIFIKTE